MKIKKTHYSLRLLTPLTIWLIAVQNNYAQKSDYVWLTGYGSLYHSAGTKDSISGNEKFDFNYNPVQIGFDSIAMNFAQTDVSISDSNGNLLFYSNGIYVANALGDTIANGDSLNAGYVPYVWNPLIEGDGYTLPQGLLALPNAYQPNQYYLVQSFLDTIPGSGGANIYNAKILNTLVDMSANGGLGSVIYKNEPIINVECSFNLTAAKHGNGRDWWLILHKLSSTCYYVVLLDSTGFQIVDSVCRGPVDPSGDGGTICFSPDGSKFIYFGAAIGLSVFDFDRCTGALTNLQYIPSSTILTTGDIYLTCSVSPNSRFLYASNGYQLFQFDLWSNNLLGSLDTVAVLDGWFLVDSFLQNYFETSQIGPDGKIYISCGDLPVINIIDSPDLQGTACNVIQHYVMPEYAYSPPNYPNYRLGALTQSQCDTLASLTAIQRAAKEQIIKVYPNPAATYAIIDYGFTDWSQPQPTLQICTALGQTIYTQTLPMYSGLQKIDVSAWAGGMYTVYIKRQNAVIATSKFVKQ